MLTSRLLQRLSLWEPSEMFILWGPAGSGKSTTVRRCVQYSYGSTDALYELRLPERGDLVRWEGFDPTVHQAVLLEEFRGQVDVDTIKKYVDKWPVRVRTFGGDRTVRPLQFWFTSNLDPREWWDGTLRYDWHPDRAALNRRTTATVLLDTPTTNPDGSLSYHHAERFFREYTAHHGPCAAGQPPAQVGPASSQ